ncbi:TRAP transporter substrate-binding protein [Enterovirga rhinocerotis]|uniref:TRAP-type mannitol/chloroaromatic compound transport system substrate-binding protein n=1 Tax=Enterovirga rhinocerotis TaxID=1339210 RepID=A0A4R7C5A1_9HYPH|nr:TRAP transporter substrate-binding protein [Enterovirga rhinocerotis]TDR93233.1 TRAP-type mannitol/chloroaromatic compound transport system substrate-binding protein [Enterovirga rhinocerotis]
MSSLRGMVAVGAFAFGVLAAAVSGAQAQATKTLRIQSSFPPTSFIAENQKYFADRVAAMSGGKLKIEMLPVGSVVPAFEVLDAVNAGVIDGGHTAIAYWLGRNRAATLFGPAPGGPFGMDVIDYLGWINDGGGQKFYEEFYKDVLKRDIHPMPLTALPNQPLGWFKEPIKSWADLKGKKCRHAGITAEVFGAAGVAAVNVPGGEIVPSAERGVIECGEFSGIGEDTKIGFATVWKHFYAPSMHEPATVLELIIKGRVWNSLAPEHREIIRSAAMDANIRSSFTINRTNAEAMAAAKAQGVTVHKTPDDILIKTLEAWDVIAKKEAEVNPFFKKVYESQREYASKVVPSRRFNDVPYSIGANYYWPENK